MKWLKLAVIAAAFMAVQLPATAQRWERHFSEEVSNNHYECAKGLHGIKCFGRYCDAKSLSCAKKTGVFGNSTETVFISEERPNYYIECQPDEIAVGMGCKGDYCDNVKLYCKKTRDVRGNCSWSEYVSEEGDAKLYKPDRLIAGIRCKGKFCDNISALFCTYTPVMIAEDLSGTWEIGCRGGQNCETQLVQTVNIGTLDESSWTDETRNAVSATVSAGGDIKGVSVESSITASHERAFSKAASLVKSFNQGIEQSCGQRFDFEKYDIHTVWQWVVTVKVLGKNVTIKTCDVACTSGTDLPDFSPASQESVGTCLKLRKID